jgi:hypothetical protein
MTAACGYVNCKVEFQKFIRKVCELFIKKQYLKYKFYGKSNCKWIELNVLKKKFIVSNFFFGCECERLLLTC